MTRVHSFTGSEASDREARDARPPRSSELGARLLSLTADIEVREQRPFLPNTPAYDHFPFAIWQNCVSRQTRRAYRDNMGYAEPAGFEPLRRAIAGYLALHRGDGCDPEQVIITPGAHAAFMIAAQLLTNPGDGLLFEDPGPFIARHLFASLGRRLVHVPVDEEGMDFEAALAKDRQVRLAFVMPSRQHPLGRTLSLSRRLRLLDWARENEAWILEDDYDSEFRYTGVLEVDSRQHRSFDEDDVSFLQNRAALRGLPASLWGVYPAAPRRCPGGVGGGIIAPGGKGTC